MHTKNYIVGIFARKLNFNRTSVENLSLKSEKVAPEYMRSVLEYVKKKIGSKEFSNSSFNPWGFIERRLKEQDLTIGELAEFLATPPYKMAKARAAFLKPCVSNNLVIRYIADQMEIAPAYLDLTTSIKNLIPPVCAHDPTGYRTLLIWCCRFFRKPVPHKLPPETTVADLVAYLSDK